jgi:hypothetical protein
MSRLSLAGLLTRLYGTLATVVPGERARRADESPGSMPRDFSLS